MTVAKLAEAVTQILCVVVLLCKVDMPSLTPILKKSACVCSKQVISH